jgi:hypothetical protein
MERLGREEAAARVVASAEALLAGRAGVIETAREMSRLRHMVDAARDVDFLTFLAIETETDGLPIGPIRQFWTPAALAEIDSEIHDAEEANLDIAKDAARSLIGKYSAQ